MEGVNGEGLDVPDAGDLLKESPKASNGQHQITPEEPIDFDAEAQALAEEELTEVPQDQGEFDELDEALTPGPEREEQELRIPFLTGRRKGAPSGPKRLVKKDEPARPPFTPQQRLLLLDTWQRSGLPANDFGALVGVSNHTLYAWKRAFDEEGPGGLMDKSKGGPRRMKLHELTKRTILMLKEKNPDWGVQRISDMLLRGPALPASPTSVAKVLHEAG